MIITPGFQIEFGRLAAPVATIPSKLNCFASVT
jgi:hypothetical protein